MKHKESVRVFSNPVLEATTHVHPVVPLVLWGPVASYLIYSARVHDRLSLATLALLCMAGLLLWTLTEYVLHRWVFHFHAQSRLGKRLVYLFHGLHHDDPNDSTRLVMPPVPTILIMSLLYSLFSFFCPAAYFHGFMAFFIIGYLCYDYIHYATHHFRMTSRVAKYLKRYHLKHHFRTSNARYGVSTPLWDIVFRTMEPPQLS